MTREILIQQLKEQHRQKKAEIKSRLAEFSQVPQEQYFEELAFCLCVAQSKARNGDLAVQRLKAKGLLMNGSVEDVAKILRQAGVRFHNNKARNIVEARSTFSPEKLNLKDPLATRRWLVENIRGLGMKGASHYLRNIGFGQNLAILDIHVLKKLIKIGYLERIPKTLSKNQYLNIEQRIKEFSNEVNIPMSYLDLLFWSEGTGDIFK